MGKSKQKVALITWLGVWCYTDPYFATWLKVTRGGNILSMHDQNSFAISVHFIYLFETFQRLHLKIIAIENKWSETFFSSTLIKSVKWMNE